MKPPTLAAVIAEVERRYPPVLAEEWDSVGLVCGDPDSEVHKILLAVDPVMAVVDEAVAFSADLVITHHPLFLRGVHSVAATTHGGRVVHTLISRGIGLMSVHTNADSACPGVSDALARLLGVGNLRPLVPSPSSPSLGLGRVGSLHAAMRLADFAQRVESLLPRTAQGVRFSGDPDQEVLRVAVIGGAGDAHVDAATAVADVVVTSDLRHHRALDHRLGGGCALIDVAHWAGEWPWLRVLAQELSADLNVNGTTLEVTVSTTPTDPWTAHVGSDS